MTTEEPNIIYRRNDYKIFQRYEQKEMLEEINRKQQ